MEPGEQGLLWAGAVSKQRVSGKGEKGYMVELQHLGKDRGPGNKPPADSLMSSK